VKGAGTLHGEHCTESGSAPAEYGHVAIAQGEKTHAKLTNANTGPGTVGAEPGNLITTVGGVEVELLATTVESTAGAWLENSKEGEEHYSHGAGKILFSGVTVTKPANCAVTSAAGAGKVETNQLIATTKGQGMNLLFTPETGEQLAEFSIVNNGGTCAAAQNNISIVGSVKGRPDIPGTTITMSESTVTTDATLHFGGKHGPVVGLGGKVTNKAGKEPETEPTHPIAYTTWFGF
jgi:hypothetical protein